MASIAASVLALAIVASAQAGAIALRPRYTPGQIVHWTATIHSAITRTAGAMSDSASLDNTSRAELRVLSTPPGGATARTLAGTIVAIRFTSYQTQVSGLGNLAASLRASTAKTDAAAMRMAPLRLRLLADGDVQPIAPPADERLEEPVALLEQLARTEDLPPGPVRVGDQWVRQRMETLAGFGDFSLPLTMHCLLTRVEERQGRKIAVIDVRTSGSAEIPAGSLSGSGAIGSSASVGGISVGGHAVQRYDVADGVLASAISTAHNMLRMAASGSGSTAQALELRVDSTGTVQRTP